MQVAHIDETMEQFDMFSTRKPRDMKAGTSSGLKSVTKGFVTGAVGLVAAPIQGAKAGGLQARLAAHVRRPPRSAALHTQAVSSSSQPARLRTQGFFLGLASGLFSAVALPVAGCAVPPAWLTCRPTLGSDTPHHPSPSGAGSPGAW